MAKAGSPEGIAREAFLFGEAAALLPVGIPTLVASGPGWILMEDVGGEPAAPDDVSPLDGLAPMHELFEGATGIEHERFRDVFGREREELLALARGSANAAALPEPLSSLLDDPSPLDRDRRRRSRGRSCTVTRGPGNVLVARVEGVRVARLGRRRCRSRGVRPLAVALRLGVGARIDEPRGSARRLPRLARTTRWSPLAFKRAVDACAILGFLLTQLARLTDREPDLIERVIERRNLIAIGLFDCIRRSASSNRRPRSAAAASRVRRSASCRSRAR